MATIWMCLIYFLRLYYTVVKKIDTTLMNKCYRNEDTCRQKPYIKSAVTLFTKKAALLSYVILAQITPIYIIFI